LKLVNEYYGSYSGATSCINNELTHLTSNSASSTKHLLPLAWFTGSLLGMECSLNYEEFIRNQGDLSLVILGFLLTSCFFYSLDLFHFSNGESSLIKTICLEVSTIMTFETLFTLQSIWWFTSNPCILVKGFDECRGSDSFVGCRVTIRGTQRANRRSGLKGFLTLKFLINLDS